MKILNYWRTKTLLMKDILSRHDISYALSELEFDDVGDEK